MRSKVLLVLAAMALFSVRAAQASVGQAPSKTEAEGTVQEHWSGMKRATRRFLTKTKNEGVASVYFIFFIGSFVASIGLFFVWLYRWIVGLFATREDGKEKGGKQKEAEKDVEAQKLELARKESADKDMRLLKWSLGFFVLSVFILAFGEYLQYVVVGGAVLSAIACTYLVMARITGVQTFADTGEGPKKTGKADKTDKTDKAKAEKSDKTEKGDGGEKKQPAQPTKQPLKKKEDN
jgi:hypothetical protein